LAASIRGCAGVRARGGLRKNVVVGVRSRCFVVGILARSRGLEGVRGRVRAGFRRGVLAGVRALGALEPTPFDARGGQVHHGVLRGWMAG